MKYILTTWALFLIVSLPVSSQLIVDHTCTDITLVPQSFITLAKMQLHIAYGHTSHGSQIITGMTGLVSFANNGGRGLSLPENIFLWNDGGTDGAIDLHDNAMDGDVGYWPDWYNNTVAYLDDPAHADVNVIMWSWCGQVDDRYSNGVLWEQYLEPMGSLETDYPDVTFVYMTGHLEYGHRENVNAANDSIRSFCRNNHKVLFDFADIESYGPDGTCYKNNGDDACNYYDESGDSIGNWAVEYQNTHTEGTDWYSCSSAHSEPLNANKKAYAAWYMFASLAGWNNTPSAIIGEENTELEARLYPNPAINQTIFEISFACENNIQVDLVSANGTLIMHNLIPQISGNKLIYTINTEKLKPAVYYLKVISSFNSEAYRLTIIH